ncbi:MAG: hypothetical protein JXA13_00225 [Anaerolineales bacterium]|nr:hypothetical protein [Anaerolineales bacterium]
MDSFDFDGPSVEERKSGQGIWDIMSIAVLIITVCIGGYFLLIFINPATTLNPFPPKPTGPFIPTATITPIQLEPTWTPTPTIQLTPSNTPRPTFTAIFTETPFSLIPETETPTPTATPKAPFTASVNAVSSTIVHPEHGCNWLGIGGTVEDQNNSPLISFTIRLSGHLNGKNYDNPPTLTISGVSPEYGQSGFEFYLGDTPTASQDELYLLLLDQAGLPISEKIYIDTFTDCAKNLILVRFKKVK